MNSTHNNRSTHPAPTFREAGPDELLKDLLRVSPAPNRSREAFVTVINIVLVGAIIGVLQPEPGVVAALVGVIAPFTAIRWVVGARKWNSR